MVGCSKNAKLDLVGILVKCAIYWCNCANESMPFDRILVCLIIFFLQVGLIHNFCLKGDEM
jgi:hypothetical protein